MSLNSVVIVGAGQAGYQVAASLRQEGYAGKIALVGDEPGLPYQRPPLSKAYLLEKISVANLYLRPESWFADQGVRLLHQRVTAIDRANARVTLANGEALSYDHLVLATGAHNRTLPVPGADLQGVIGIRTLAHADLLIPRVKAARNIVVIGAGFIGLEFAAVAASLGAAVHVVELADRPMARALSRPMAQVFRDAHEGWGVKFDFHQGLASIEGQNGHATTVVTTDGRRLPADLVVYGIGVLPNVTLAAEAGLDIENGIRVDAHLLTADPAISAIGDAAAFPSLHAGAMVRLESVQNAVDQARTVAARLMGKPAPYAALPWFWSDQGDLKLQIAGLSTGHDQTVVLGEPASGHCTVLCFKGDGLLLAVETSNKPADHMAARKILARGPALTAAVAAAPGFDLRAWEAANR
jgi:NADPH-dependent 2,4-dienoyl-CoA reductase/sulfur reductase-like enzyme